MRIFPETYCLDLVNGYSIVQTLSNGVNRVYLQFFGFTVYVSIVIILCNCFSTNVPTAGSGKTRLA